MRTLVVTADFWYGNARHTESRVATGESDIFHFLSSRPYSFSPRNATTVARLLWSGDSELVDDFSWTEVSAREVCATPSIVRRVVNVTGWERRRNVGETAEHMRACMLDYIVRSAEALQWVEDSGMAFCWEDDWMIGSHRAEYGDDSAYADGEPETCESCSLLDSDGDIIGSLGCIDDADDAYRFEVEVDLAIDAMPRFIQPTLPMIGA